MFKRFISYLCLVFTFVAFTITAKAQLNETFNNLSTGIPSGWDNSDYKSDIDPWQFYAEGYEGSAVACKAVDVSTSIHAVLKTPVLLLGVDAQLSFYYKTTKSNVGKMSVYVICDGETILLDSELSSTYWSYEAYDLSEYSGKNVQIYFKLESGGNSNATSASSWFILDNVKVSNKPTCKMPQDIFISSLQSTSATIGWSLSDVGDDTETYLLEVKNMKDGTVTSSTITAPDMMYQIKNLKSDTEYEVFLTADCSGTGRGTSEAAKISFSTLCSSQRMPYSVNFDNYSLPDCWFMSEGGGVSFQATIKEGKDGAAAKLESTASSEAYLISKQLNQAANRIQISMSVYGAKGTKFSILFTPDPFDLTQAIPLWDNQEILHDNVWYNLTYNTRLFDITDKKMSLVILVPAGQNSTLYVDNVAFKGAPTCAKLNNLREVISDSTFTQIDWDEFMEASNYEVVVSNADTTMTYFVSSHPSILDGLSKNTKYNVKARVICSEGDTAEWSNTISIQTTCGLREEPIFFEDFESGIFPPDCWFKRQTVKVPAMVYDSGDDTWRLGSEELYVTSRSGNYCADWQAQAVGNKAILVTQPIWVDQPCHYDLSMWVYRNDYRTFQGKTVMPIEGEGLNIWVNNRPDTIGGTKLGFINSFYSQSPVEDVAGYHNYEYNIPLSGKVYIIFEGVSRNAYDIQIDDIEVKLAPLCRKVSEIKISDITTRSVKLSWRKGLNETKWHVKYNLVSGQSEIKDSVVVTGSPELIINNLTPASFYTLQASIVADCGSGDLTAPVSFSQKFETECDAINVFPYTQTFDGELFPPHCWSQYQSQPPADPNAFMISDYKDQAWIRNVDMMWSPELIKAGAASAKLQASSAGIKSALVSPMFAFENGKTYVVSFWMYRMPEPKDFDNASAVDNEGLNILLNGQPVVDGATKLGYINVGSQFVPKVEQEGYYKYEFEISATGNQHIIFEGVHQGSQMSMYIDNVVIREKSACGDFDVKVDSIKTTVARAVSLDSSVAEWQVSVGEPGFNPNSGAIFNATGASVIITGLTAQTDYELYSRRRCDDGTYGPWSEFVISFATQCAPITVDYNNPFFDGFETFSVEEEILGCYQQAVYGHGGAKYYASDGARNDDGVVTITAYEGNVFANLPFDNDTWLFRPFELKADKNYEVSVMGRQDCNFGMTLSLAYCVEPDITTVVDTMYSAELLSEWKEYKGWINVPEDGVYYIGVNILTWGFSSQQNNSAIDNFTVKEIDCAPPVQIKESKITSQSADIDFHSIADVWEVKVASVEFDPEFGIADVAHDTIREMHYTVGGLSTNKDYFYSFRSLCSEPSEWSHVKSFRTVCSSFDLPYYDDFEDPELNNIVCWSSILNNEYLSKSEPSLTRHYQGNVSYKMYESMTILPKFNVTTLANYLIKGYVYSDNKSDAHLGIGVVADITNPKETYEAIADVVVTNREDWTEFVAYFSILNEADYADFRNAQYIAFVATNETEFYIDNIEIVEIPTCLSPTEIKVSDITSNSCEISWFDNAKATQWQVQGFYKNELLIDTIVKNNPAIITGLMPASAYEFKIRTVCSDVDQSWWTEVGDVTTECASYTLPYDQTFDGLEASQCWTQGLAYPNVAENYWVHKNNAYYYEQHVEQEEDNFFYPETSTSTILSPSIDLTQNKNVELSFDVVYAQSGVLRVLLSDDGCISFDTLDVKSFGFDGQYNLKYDLSAYVGKIINIGIDAQSSGIKDSYIYIDNFSVEEVKSCVRPAALSALFVYDTRAKMKLTDETSNSSWQYAVGTVGFMPDTIVPVTIKNKEFEITNLTPRSNYEVYIRSVCNSNVYSDWRGPISIQTACPMEVSFPYHESFEGINSVDNNCFSIFSFKPTNDRLPYAELNVRSYVSDGVQAMKLVSSPDYYLYFALPLFNEPLRNLKLSFDYKTEFDEGYPTIATPIELGVMSDLSVETSYTKLIDLPYSDSETGVFATCNYSFADAPAMYDLSDKYIVIRYGKTPEHPFTDMVDAGIDNIEIVPADYCYAIENLNFIDFTETGVTVNWANRNEGSTTFEYRVLENNVEVQRSTISALPLVITGLNSATDYTLEVRCLCSANNYSDWEAFNFRTLAFAPQLPYETSFDDEESKNWVLYTEGQTNYFIVGEDKLSVRTGDKALYITDDGVTNHYNVGATSSSYAMRVIDFEKGEYKISYSWKSNGEYTDIQTADYARVYLAPVSKKLVAGTRISRYSGDIGGCIMLDGGKGLAVSPRWNEVSVDVVFTEPVKYNLVIEWYNNSMSGAQTPFAIDDVKIVKNPCPTPTKINILSVDDRSANISIETTVDADAYEYRLSLTENIDEAIIVDTVYSKQFDLLELLASTQYHLFVRSLCSDDFVSNYQTVSFTTEKVAALIPYVTDFTDVDENTNWVLLGGSEKNKFAISQSQGLFVTAGDSLNGDAVYGYDSYKESAVYAYRLFDFEKGQYVVSYDYKSEGSKLDYGRIFIVPSDYEITAGERIGYVNETTNKPSLPAECISLDANAILANTIALTNREESFFITEPGRYKLVVQWYNKGNYTGTLPLKLNNISFEKASCADIDLLAIQDVDYQSITATFRNYNESPSVCAISTTPDVELAFDVDTVFNETVSFDDLAGNTTYYIFVKAACYETLQSQWKMITATTDCAPYEVTAQTPYFEGFELYNKGAQLDECWNISYKHDDKKLVVTDEVDVHYNLLPFEGGKYLSFERGNNQISVRRDFYLEAGVYYAISLWAITSSRIELDERSSTTLDIVDFSHNQTLISKEVGYDAYGEVRRIFMPQESGIYSLGFIYNVGLAVSYASIDNFSVEVLSFGAPDQLTITDITKTTAQVSWIGAADEYQVQLYKGTELVVDTVVTDPELLLSKLSPATTYKVMLRGRIVATEQESAWVEEFFTTECDVALPTFTQDFEGIAPNSIPVCWDNMSESSLADYDKGWNVKLDSRNHVMSVNTSEVYGTVTILSPKVYLNDNLILSYSYRNLTHTENLKVEIRGAGSRQFTDVILDGGHSGWQQCIFDLAEYKGDTIQLAFTVVATGNREGNIIELDDIRIARYAGEFNYYGSVCLGSDFWGDGFSISKDQLFVGVNKFDKFVISDQGDTLKHLEVTVNPISYSHTYDTICKGDIYTWGDISCLETGMYEVLHRGASSCGCDSIAYLHLEVLDFRTNIDATICEGEYYMFGGEKLTETGIYADTIPNPGSCDSIKVLTLRVIPTMFETSMTICDSEPLSWNDTTLTTSGRYVKRYENLNGCDSIEVINLTVLPTNVYLDATICQGTTYLFRDKELSEAGVYVDSMVNILGCDSIITLTLSVSEPARGIFEDYACEGYEYRGFGFNLSAAEIVADTILYRTIPTIEGCDSIVQLNLDFIKTAVVDTVVTISDGDFYDFGEVSLNTAGQYTETFATSLGCDSVVNLTLIVETGVDNIYALPMIIAPNPISGGQTAFINHQFTIEEQHGLRLEVINSLGQLVLSDTPTIYPLSISDISVSGLYYIRITTGTGDRYIGKLVVE